MKTVEELVKKIEEIDAEIQTTQNKINDLFAHQQRLLGYRQALMDQQDENGAGKSSGPD